MISQHYPATETYAALTKALANVKPDPLTGRVEPHSFVEALGEIGGIWPALVLDDPARGCVPGSAHPKPV